MAKKIKNEEKVEEVVEVVEEVQDESVYKHSDPVLENVEY